MASVDVAIPCYNYANYLETCIASVLSQRDVDVRILIIDDASPDNTPDVAARLVASDPRISYVRNATNLGLIGTANRGVIDWAQSPYTLLLSADDVLAEGALARATQALDAHPEAGFAYGNAIIFNDILPPAPQDSAQFEYRLIDGPSLIEQICRHANHIPSPTVVTRTSLQKLVGGYNARTRHTSDMEMWMRLAARGDVIAIGAAQAYYRVHAANMTGSFVQDPTRDFEQRLTAAREALTAVGDRIPQFAGWYAGMKRHLARETLRLATIACEFGEMERCDAFLKFAGATDPSLRASKTWWTTLIKRRLGAHALRRLRSLVGARSWGTASMADEIKPWAPQSPGEIWGWWPASFTGQTFHT